MISTTIAGQNTHLVIIGWVLRNDNFDNEKWTRIVWAFFKILTPEIDEKQNRNFYN